MASTTLPGTPGPSSVQPTWASTPPGSLRSGDCSLDMLRRDHPRRRRSGRADRQAPRLRADGEWLAEQRMPGRARAANLRRCGERGEGHRSSERRLGMGPGKILVRWKAPIPSGSSRSPPCCSSPQPARTRQVHRSRVPAPTPPDSAASASRPRFRVECGGCARASERATVRVICPEVIPDVPLFTPGAGLHGAASFKPTYYMLSFNNGDPPGPARHWIVGGGLASAVGKWVLTDIANATKGDPSLSSGEM